MASFRTVALGYQLNLLETEERIGEEVTNWEVSWHIGEYGRIDRISLVDTNGEEIEVAVQGEDEYLSYSRNDAGHTVSIQIPFLPPDPLSGVWPGTVLSETCAGNPDEQRIDIARSVTYAVTGEYDYVAINMDESNDSDLALQMFTERQIGEGSETCLEFSNLAFIYHYNYRFGGPYAEWFELREERSNLIRVQEGLTFDDQGVLVESSSGVFTPKEGAPTAEIGLCPDSWEE